MKRESFMTAAKRGFRSSLSQGVAGRGAVSIERSIGLGANEGRFCRHLPCLVAFGRFVFEAGCNEGRRGQTLGDSCRVGRGGSCWARGWGFAIDRSTDDRWVSRRLLPSRASGVRSICDGGEPKLATLCCLAAWAPRLLTCDLYGKRLKNSKKNEPSSEPVVFPLKGKDKKSEKLARKVPIGDGGPLDLTFDFYFHHGRRSLNY